MVIWLSVIIAIILTFILAVGLYPIAGAFWVLGLFGQVSGKLFDYTTRIIKKLWSDLKGEGGAKAEKAE